MKRLILLAIFSLVFGSTLTDAKAPSGFGVSVDFFYSSLSPYGEWVQSDFGYCWRPVHISQGWRPYMYGRWAWTDYGWYWVSSEPFGWATFHYGRWIYDDYYGWIWAPDDQWGPAWVEWRYNDDYVGWAPLSPYAEFSVNFGVRYRNHWAAPVHYWNFVPCRNFTSVRVVDYMQPIERSRRFFGNTRGSVDIVSQDHRIVNRGIDVGFIERHSNAPVRRIDVVARDRGVGGGDRVIRDQRQGERIEAYRPRIEGQRRSGADIRQQPGTRRDYERGRSDVGRSPRGVGQERTPRPEMQTPPPQQPSPERQGQRQMMNQNGQQDRRQVQQQRQWQRQEDKMRQQQMRDRQSKPNVRPEAKPQLRERPQPRPTPKPQESRGGGRGGDRHR